MERPAFPTFLFEHLDARHVLASVAVTLPLASIADGAVRILTTVLAALFTNLMLDLYKAGKARLTRPPPPAVTLALAKPVDGKPVDGSGDPPSGPSSAGPS